MSLTEDQQRIHDRRIAHQQARAKVPDAEVIKAMDEMRRHAKALNGVFDAISVLPFRERVELLEEVLEVLDPEYE